MCVLWSGLEMQVMTVVSIPGVYKEPVAALRRVAFLTRLNLVVGATFEADTHIQPVGYSGTY